MHQEGHGCMLAVLKCSRDAIESTIKKHNLAVDLANINAPGQIILSGLAVDIKKHRMHYLL